jgi:acetate---CoA ligase (ADP-forming)
MAALASDICDEERIPVPELRGLEPDVVDVIEQASGESLRGLTLNPVDLTGFMAARPDLLRVALDRYLGAPEVDALVFAWLLDDGSGEWAESTVAPLAELAAESDKPVVLASMEDGEVAGWAWDYRGRGVAIGRGFRGAVRGLATMGEFVRATAVPRERPAPVAALPRPAAMGPILPFATTMKLLREFDVPVAPFCLVGEVDEPGKIALPFGAPFVAKLADAPHRTELDAVRFGLAADGLADAVDELRRLARANGLPEAVAIQPQLEPEGEAFVGAQAESDVGPIVVCGVGGTLVELLAERSARVAPFGPEQARAMIAELSPAVVGGFRGARPWDVEQLASIASSVSRLVAGADAWLSSLDVNPLVLTSDGFVAVDGLCILREEHG